MGNYRNFKLVYYFVAAGTARANREQLEKEIAFFEKYLRPDKVYLEPFRSGVMAGEDQVELVGLGELVENVENRPAGIREDRVHAHALEPLDDDARARAGLHTGLRGRFRAAGIRFGFVLHGVFPLGLDGKTRTMLAVSGEDVKRLPRAGPRGRMPSP